MAPDQPPTTSAWSEEKEKKLKWLEKEVARLRKLNDGLQQALSAKVLDADQRLYCVTSTGITMTAEFQAEGKWEHFVGFFVMLVLASCLK